MGSVKLLQFRLDFDTTYDSRWSSLNETVAALAPNRWGEGTASFLFHHPNTVDQLRAEILRASTIYRDGRDMLLILDLATHRVAQIGVRDPAWLAKVLAAGNPLSQVA